MIEGGEFPAPISLHENVEYVRTVLKNTIQFTGDKEGYTNVKDLPKNGEILKKNVKKNAFLLFNYLLKLSVWIIFVAG